MPGSSLTPESVSAPRRAQEQLPRVVIGYDGSASARAAVDWAVASLPVGSTIVLVYASGALHSPLPPLGVRDERRHAARACFEELTLEADDAFLSRQLETEISDMDPVSALIDAAGRHRALGIVVGLDRHSRLRAAAGTVSSELLRRSPVPVTAVPV